MTSRNEPKLGIRLIPGTPEHAAEHAAALAKIEAAARGEIVAKLDEGEAI